MGKKIKKASLAKLFLVIVFALTLLMILISITNNLKAGTNTEEGLRQFYLKQVDLQKQGASGVVYDQILSPESKLESTKDEYIEFITKYNEKYPYTEYEINNVVVKDNVGYIDRTEIRCESNPCSSPSRKRQYRKYIYSGNRWYMVVEKDPILCIRFEPYRIPPEFERAISLIVQRFGDGNEIDREWSVDIQSIKNCLNIQYALLDSQLGEAEGVFSFMPSQDYEQLDIMVSPRYKVTSDIITASLLVHEITHAINFRGNQIYDEKRDCYVDEAIAFTSTRAFLDALNKTEFDSLNAYLNANPSLELQNLLDSEKAILRYPGVDYHNKALAFVKDNPYYQHQCSTQQ